MLSAHAYLLFGDQHHAARLYVALAQALGLDPEGSRRTAPGLDRATVELFPPRFGPRYAKFRILHDHGAELPPSSARPRRAHIEVFLSTEGPEHLENMVREIVAFISSCHRELVTSWSYSGDVKALGPTP